MVIHGFSTLTLPMSQRKLNIALYPMEQIRPCFWVFHDFFQVNFFSTLNEFTFDILKALFSFLKMKLVFSHFIFTSIAMHVLGSFATWGQKARERVQQGQHRTFAHKTNTNSVSHAKGAGSFSILGTSHHISFEQGQSVCRNIPGSFGVKRVGICIPHAIHKDNLL